MNDETYKINHQCFFCGVNNKIKKIYIVVNVAKGTTQQLKKRVICKKCGLNIYGYSIINE